MTAQDTFVIVGASLAGAKAAEALRTGGFVGRVVLLGEEAERPYERPPLSKDYLQGKSEKEDTYVHPDGWYAAHDIELRVDDRVTAIDRVTHQVIAQDGEPVGYDKLLMATGSSPRRLHVPGSELNGVLYLRDLQDCETIKAAFTTAKRVAIVGAGWIGLETAAAARAADVDVTMLEMGKLPLLGVLGPEMAGIYAALHAEHGVELRTGVEVAEIIGAEGRATGVRLTDGSLIDADVVVVGIGILPNTELAEMADLTIDNGIRVDECLATSDPDVFAAGDVANAYYPHLGTHLRLEHWSAALNQGPVAAANMMGQNRPYDRVPYFFSDQYDMGMEYSGYVEKGHYDEVLFRGDVEKGEFIAFWMGEGRVLAGMNVNVWDVSDSIAALVRSKAQVDPAKLADPTVSLEAVSLEDVQGGTVAGDARS
jgi:3-phenylpropionate/trans-cinnamate dioxygenase ferredoxin reductase subunit